METYVCRMPQDEHKVWRWTIYASLEPFVSKAPINSNDMVIETLADDTLEKMWSEMFINKSYKTYDSYFTFLIC